MAQYKLKDLTKLNALEQYGLPPGMTMVYGHEVIDKQCGHVIKTVALDVTGNTKDILIPFELLTEVTDDNPFDPSNLGSPFSFDIKFAADQLMPNKYPILKFKKDISPGELPLFPGSVKAGDVIDLNKYPSDAAKGFADILRPYIQMFKSDNPVIEIIDKGTYLSEPTIPPTLSDAILQGSEDSEQAIGAYFDPTQPPTASTPGIWPLNKSSIKKFTAYHNLYSSFLIPSLPMAATHNLFQIPVGQGTPGGSEAGAYNWQHTNMIVNGMIPIHMGFTIKKIKVHADWISTPGLHRFLSHSYMRFRTATEEHTLGTLSMFTTPHEITMPLDPCMDFNVSVTHEAYAMEELMKEWHPKTYWLEKYIPISKLYTPKYIRVWVILTGIIQKSIS